MSPSKPAACSSLTSLSRATDPGAIPTACASRQRASYAGLATPASASRCSAARSSARGSVTDGLEAGLHVGLDAGRDHGLEGAVEHPVEVVGLVARAMVGDAVLRVVVGADPSGPVDRSDLRAAGVAGLGTCLLLGL